MKALINRMRSAGVDGDQTYCLDMCVKGADALEKVTAERDALAAERTAFQDQCINLKRQMHELRNERDGMAATVVSLCEEIAKIFSLHVAFDVPIGPRYVMAAAAVEQAKAGNYLPIIAARDAHARVLALMDAIGVVENYRVSVGNSSSGELAAEWTMENLREIREELCHMADEAKKKAKWEKPNGQT